jgi:hypothetical protein
MTEDKTDNVNNHEEDNSMISLRGMPALLSGIVLAYISVFPLAAQTSVYMIYGADRGVHNFELGEKYGINVYLPDLENRDYGTGIGSQLQYNRNFEFYGAGISHTISKWKFDFRSYGNIRTTDSGGGYDRDFFLYPNSRQTVPGINPAVPEFRDSQSVFPGTLNTWSFVNTKSHIRVYSDDLTAVYLFDSGIFLSTGLFYNKYLLTMYDAAGYTQGKPVYYPGKVMTIDSEMYKAGAGPGYRYQSDWNGFYTEGSFMLQAGVNRLADYHHLRGWRDSIINYGNGYMLKAGSGIDLFSGFSFFSEFLVNAYYSYGYNEGSERTPGNNEADIIYYLLVNGKGSSKWVSIKERSFTWGIKLNI